MLPDGCVDVLFHADAQGVSHARLIGTMTRALVVPAGEHRIELRYRDRFFDVGAAISAATLVACIAVMTALRLRRAKP